MKRLLLYSLLLAALPLGAIETTIKGGRMEMVNQGEYVLFTGGVRLDHGTDRMDSSRMRTNRARDKVTSNGNVRLFRQVSSTETWQGFGEEGFYDTKTTSGYLLGSKAKKAHVIHTEILSSTSTRMVEVYGDRIDFDRNAQKAVATGNVQGRTLDPNTGDATDFWADRADFYGDKKEIVLSGKTRPILVQIDRGDKKTITADKIVYNADLKRLVSEGNAQAVLEDSGDKKKK